MQKSTSVTTMLFRQQSTARGYQIMHAAVCVGEVVGEVVLALHAKTTDAIVN
jgi:hypothetical protein